MPKTIATYLNLNHSTVRKTLLRMLAEKDSPLISERRGWYRHKMDIDTIAKIGSSKRIELHGIKVQGTCLDKNVGYSFAQAARQQYRKRGTYKEVFEGRIVTITIHKMGLVEVWIKASPNPLSFPEFDRFQAWLRGLLSFVRPSSWSMIQLGVNVDVRGLSLVGLKSISLSVFRNAWFQIYQKGEDTVRFETHLTTNLNLNEAISIMRQLVETRPPMGDPIYLPSCPNQDDPAVR